MKSKNKKISILVNLLIIVVASMLFFEILLLTKIINILWICEQPYDMKIVVYNDCCSNKNKNYNWTHIWINNTAENISTSILCNSISQAFANHTLCYHKITYFGHNFKYNFVEYN